MTKQKSNQKIEIVVTPEFSNQMLYENEKNRSAYLERALEEERKRTSELEQLLKESQMSHEVTVKNYATMKEKYDEMASLVGTALSVRRK